MSEDTNESDEVAAMLKGGLLGAFCGAVIGSCVAWLTGGLFTIVGGFVVFHIGLAMLMTGTWTGPTFFLSSKPETKQ